MIDVSEHDLKTVQNILKTHAPECAVRAFGSRVKGAAEKYSDLDLVFLSPKKLPRKTLVLLKEAFEESDLPFRVDVLDWHTISNEFRKLISEHCTTVQKEL